MVVLDAVRSINKVKTEELAAIAYTYVSDEFSGNIITDDKVLYEYLILHNSIGFNVEYCDTLSSIRVSCDNGSVLIVTKPLGDYSEAFNLYTPRFQVFDIG